MIHGKHPALINVTYIKPDRKTGTHEGFEVVYLDDNDDVRYSVEPADVDIYFTKPEYRDYQYNKPEERMEKLTVKRVPYSRISKAIENDIGDQGSQFVRSCIEARDFGSINKLYLWPYSFRADFMPEFYYMHEWMLKYGQRDKVRLTKAYLDIEVDQLDYTIDLDNLRYTAHAPVNCATVLFESTCECHTFVLSPREIPKYHDDPDRRKRFDSQQRADYGKLLRDPESLIQKLIDAFSGMYGEFRYVLHFHDSELELIRGIFDTINERKPNFCLCWNMRFDIQYLMHRLGALTGSMKDAADIICHPDARIKQVGFKTDTSTFLLEKQFDYFYVHGYTHYVCQMRLFSGIRKSQHSLKSVSLNYIANMILHDKKIEYDNEYNIIDFPYLALERFIIYNVKDTMLQFGIENKVNDIMSYYLRSVTNCTPYQKIFRETHLLRNIREVYFNQNGWVQGNNINIIHLNESKKVKSDPFSTLTPEEMQDTLEREAEKEVESTSDPDSDMTNFTFKGAIMAEPTMNDNVGMTILGKPSNTVFQNTANEDMARFYPAIKIMSNMDPITLIGKTILPNEQFITGKRVNRSLNQVYRIHDKKGNERDNDHSGEAIQTFLSGNTLTFGYNWLGFDSVTDLYTTVLRKLKNND